jgi:cellulose synthase/poly-beta-1,6-N-acetylglucosamine synthase-like glycosyltransferase
MGQLFSMRSVAVDARAANEIPTSIRMAPVSLVRNSASKPITPVVSVVVSTRNHGRYIAQMVRAVMAQDLEQEIELIVCDDDSFDDTQDVMTALVAEATRPLKYMRLRLHLGPSRGRNIALAHATGQFIAFTDSDCVPDRGWLRCALASFEAEDVGVVQGRTEPVSKPTPLFTHFMQIERLDGTFSTCNVVYRREALDTLRFNPLLWYREDVDLGWRVCERGWRPAFAADAVVAHQLIPMTWLAWLGWPLRLANLPAITRYHRRFREHLFLGIWARPINLCFELALVSVVGTRWLGPAALLLGTPYVIAFMMMRGVNGRFPPAKIAAQVCWDAIAFVALLTGTIRSRSIVL